MRTTSALRAAASALFIVTTIACSGGRVVRPQLPNGGHDPTGLAKCSVAANKASPLVTEWPASEKANLESRLREGGVAVAYSGCEMRLLPQCKVGGTYKWSKTTLAEDTVDIRSEDDLYAKLPLGAASLEAELKSSGRLAVRTTVAGQMKLDGVATADVPTTGECAGATHVIGGIAVGAFRLYSGGAAKASAGAGVGSAGATVSTGGEEVLMRKAGDAAKCEEATNAEPSPECASPIQMFLWPLPKKAEASAGGSADGPAPPNAVRMNFLLPDAEEKWRLMNGAKVVCDLPCSQWVVRGTKLSLRRDGAKMSDTLSIDLPPELGGYTVGRSVDAVPLAETPMHNVLAIVGLSVGGSGALFGPMFWARGLNTAEPEPNSVKAGQIMIGIGLPVLALGIVGILTGQLANSVDLTLSPDQAARVPAVRLGPGFISAGSTDPRGFRMLVSPRGITGAF